MKIIFVSFFLLLAFGQLHAQTSTTYNRAIGVKFPGGFAVSYKQFVRDYQNVEAEAMYWNQGFRVVGLYEFNWDIPSVDGMRWYAGAGAHLGAWNNTDSKQSNNSSIGFGIDGVIGLDYKLADYPIDISLAWQPALDLVGSTGYNGAYGGIGVRYTF